MKIKKSTTVLSCLFALLMLSCGSGDKCYVCTLNNSQQSFCEDTYQAQAQQTGADVSSIEQYVSLIEDANWVCEEVEN